MSTQANAVKVLKEEIEKDKRWIEACLSIKPKEVYFTEQKEWDNQNHTFKEIPHLLTPVSFNKESIRFKILACDDTLEHIMPVGRRATSDITFFYEAIGTKECKLKRIPKEDVPLYLGYKFVDPSLTKFMVKSN
jgi:hypothetical protein